MRKENNNNIKTGYKHTSLGWIPEDWEVKRLGEICANFKSGNGITSENISKEGNYPVYGGNGLRGFTNNYTHEGNYFLIGRQGALCGNIVRVSGKNYISEHAIAVQTDIENNTSFLAYKLEFLNLNRLSESSAQPGLSVEKLVKLKISIPPLPEQRAIADLLSTWDKTIEKTSQLIAKKELRKKWLMQQLLTGKKRLNHGLNGLNDDTDAEEQDQCNPEIRLIRDSDNKVSEKQPETNEIQNSRHFSGFEEWKEVRLGDIFDRVTRKNNEGNTNVVTISAQRGFVRQNDFFNKIVASDTLDNYFLVYKGEFCYNKSYSNGYPWGATKRLKNFDSAVVTTLYICFGLKDKQAHSADFFEHYFEAGLLDNGLTKIAHEGGRAHGLLNVTPTDFFNLRLTIPAMQEQTAIATVLQIADKEIQLLKSKLEYLKEQKKGLMQVLLTGKKRLKIEENSEVLEKHSVLAGI